jgi:DNA-binding PadR family transcriptional regulator
MSLAETPRWSIARSMHAPPSAGGLPRRLYRATPLGRQVLNAWSAVSSRLIQRFAR